MKTTVQLCLVLQEAEVGCVGMVERKELNRKGCE